MGSKLKGYTVPCLVWAALALALAGGCAHPVASRALEPGSVRRIARDYPTAAAALAQIRAILAQNGIAMAEARPTGPVELYFYQEIRRVSGDIWEIREKTLAWDQVRGVEVICPDAGGECSLVIRGPFAYSALDWEAVAPREEAELLHGLILRLRDLARKGG